MSDKELRALAAKVGIASEWTDQKGKAHAVAPETLRPLLVTLGLDCGSARAIRRSLARLRSGTEVGAPPLLTTRIGEALALPAALGQAGKARLVLEGGEALDIALAEDAAGRTILPALERAGYHRLEAGGREVTIAAAPRHCFGVGDVAPGERIYGLAAQIYGLRRSGDGGIGDMGGVAALATGAARHGADALTLSPVHALFTALPGRFGPYSPSSRLFYNPLHADPAHLFGPERVRALVDEAGLGEEMARLEALALIDWPRAAQIKLELFRALHKSFARGNASAARQTRLARDFADFRREGGELLAQHACFEALQALRLRQDPASWSWREWSAEWRDPASPTVAAFAREHEGEVGFHVFLQWLIARSLAAAQDAGRRAGMRIGLISDLAIGMDDAGSHAWSRQREVLVGATVGAPPDYYNANGQNWGLTTFSPLALVNDGFAPFVATLRAAMRHAGGLRIDHVMGMARLWLIPEGAAPTAGAYMSFPAQDLFHLIALESFRHRAIVIGEDLGTLPHGFRARLDAEGLAGMQVLRFERDPRGFFMGPETYRPNAIAMASTHDLAPTAGWWAGHDIETRSKIPAMLSESAAAAEREARSESRHFLWGALVHAGTAQGAEPAPEAADVVADAAARYVAMTPAALAILPLEEALGIREQPNLPGTVLEHPNWRMRLPGEAAALLDRPEAAPRLEAMRRRKGK